MKDDKLHQSEKFSMKPTHNDYGWCVKMSETWKSTKTLIINLHFSTHTQLSLTRLDGWSAELRLENERGISNRAFCSYCLIGSHGQKNEMITAA